jgi:hypothetical protein
MPDNTTAKNMTAEQPQQKDTQLVASKGTAKPS